MTSCCRRAAVPRLSFWNRMAGTVWLALRSIGASLVARGIYHQIMEKLVPLLEKDFRFARMVTWLVPQLAFPGEDRPSKDPQPLRLATRRTMQSPSEQPTSSVQAVPSVHAFLMQ